MWTALLIWSAVSWPRPSCDPHGLLDPPPKGVTALYKALDERSTLWITVEHLDPSKFRNASFAIRKDAAGKWLFPTAAERYTVRLEAVGRRTCLGSADCVHIPGLPDRDRGYDFYDAKLEGESILVATRIAQMVALCELPITRSGGEILSKGRYCVLTWDRVGSGMQITSARIRGNLHDGTLVVRARNAAGPHPGEIEYAVTRDAAGIWRSRVLDRAGDVVYRKELSPGMTLNVTAAPIEIKSSRIPPANRPASISGGSLEVSKAQRYRFYINDPTTACGWKEVGGSFDQYWFKGTEWAADPPRFLDVKLDGPQICVLCQRDRLIELLIIDTVHAVPPKIHPALTCEILEDEPGPPKKVVSGSIEGHLDDGTLGVQVRLDGGPPNSREYIIRLVNGGVTASPVSSGSEKQNGGRKTEHVR